MSHLSIDQALARIAKGLLAACPCIALAFPIKFANSIILVIAAIWLYQSLREKSLFRFRSFNIAVLTPLLHYVILIAGLIYTSNLVMGVKVLETKIPLLIFPLIFFSGYDLFALIRKRDFYDIYCSGITLICTYVLGVTIFRLLINANGVGYTFKELSGVIDVHPGYFSLYVGFATLLLIVRVESLQGFKKALAIFQILILFTFNFLLVARMPMVGFICSAVIYLVVTKKYKAGLTILSFSLLLLFAIGRHVPDWTNRIAAPAQMLINGNLEELQKFAFDRVQEFTCSTGLLAHDVNFLTGFGTGDDNDKLYECYAHNGYDWVLSQKYNAHNQYVQSTLQTGILGGLSFLLMIFAPMVQKKTDSKDLNFILFTVLFGFFSLTESTLEVQKGVIFFSFFYSLFVYFETRSQERPISQQL